MKRFEYLTFRATQDTVGWVSDGYVLDKDHLPEVHTFLNERGAEGWELVAVVEVEVPGPSLTALLGDTHFIQQFFLKRVITESA